MASVGERTEGERSSGVVGRPSPARVRALTRRARLAQLARRPPFPLRPLLVLGEVFYGAAAIARNVLFDVGVRKTHDAGVPVVSVGNLTVGGTGKTPFVLMLAREALRAGYRPAVVLRGYGARRPEEADEARLLARRLAGVRVVVDPDRVRGARRAAAEGADLVLLDDGFQHRRLGRDADIVLLDAREPLGNGAVLPAGPLREPVSALRRATLLALTRCGRLDPPGLEATRRFLEDRFGKPVVAFDHVAVALEEGGDTLPLARLRGERVLAFSGIGDPETLADTLARLGARVVEAVDFGDHHAYRPADLERIRRRAESLAVDRVVTTEKDRERLPPIDRIGPAPLGVLVVETRPLAPADAHRLARILPFRFAPEAFAGA